MSKIMLANADPIVEYLLGKRDESEMDPKDIKMWKLIHEMSCLAQKYQQKSKVVKIFEKLHPEISQSTIYRYWNRMEYVLGTSHLVNKGYWRLRIQEILLKAIKLDLDREETKNIARLIEQLIKALGLDDDKTIKPEDLGRHTFIVSSDPRVAGFDPIPIDKVQQLINKLDLDSNLSQQLLKDAETIDFKEVKDEPGNDDK